MSGNLTAAVNALFVNAANGRVGIGTTAPNQKLTVVGNLNLTGNLTATNITATSFETYTGKRLDNVEESYSYLIYTDGTTIYAKNGTTGKIDFSGTDVSTVIQNALNALTSGRTWKEKIVLKGNFTSLSNTIFINSTNAFTIFDFSQSKLKIPDNFNKSIIIIDLTTDVELRNGEIDGNRAGQSVYMYGLHILNSSNINVNNFNIRNVLGSAVAIINTTDSNLENILMKNTASGIGLGDSTDIILKNIRGIDGTAEEIIDVNLRNNRITIDTVYGSGDNYEQFMEVNNNSNNTKIMNFNLVGRTANVGILVSGGAANTLIQDGYINQFAGLDAIRVTATGGCSGTTTIRGVYVLRAPNNGIAIGCPNTIIKDNVVNGSNHGIYVTTAPNSIVEGNIVTSNLRNGIYLDGSTNVSVFGNQVLNNNQINAAYYGIVVGGAGANNIIKNNVISGILQDYGIYFSSATTNNWAEGNRLQYNIAPIANAGSSNVLIQNYNSAPFNFGNNATAPTPFGAGDTYFNTATKLPCYYNGTHWNYLINGSSGC